MELLSIAFRLHFPDHLNHFPSLRVDLNAIESSLSREGEVVSEGEATATDSLGDQWQALLYLVNEIAAEGYTIEPGQTIITGSMTAIFGGRPRHYRGDFGSLGSVEFTVAP